MPQGDCEQRTGRTGRRAANLGIALYPDHGQDVESLLAASDAALYQMKRQGRDGCRLAAG